MSIMKFEYLVKREDINLSVKEILKEKMYVSNILLRKLRDLKAIFVNNLCVFTNHIVKENDLITIDLSKIVPSTKFEDKFKLKKMPLEILYEDEYLLILNKPANMPVHPSCDNYENTLSNGVAHYLKKQGIYNIHIVTRLDHNTTGICIFAKHSYIQELFVQKKTIINLKKQYIAIVHGILKDPHGIIDMPIARKENTIILREVNPNGKNAKTEYYVQKINSEKKYSILKIILHTGRTHQIRVHMSHIGHSLLGDELYANANYNDIYKYIKRQALHCFSISFTHPVTKKNISITCDLPDDMSSLI